MRWTWVGLAIASTIGYLWMNPLIVVVWLQDDDEGRMESERDGKVDKLEDEEVDAEGVLMMDTGVEGDGAAGA